MVGLIRDTPAGALGSEAIEDADEEYYLDVVQPVVESAPAEHVKVSHLHSQGHDPYELEAATGWSAPPAG